MKFTTKSVASGVNILANDHYVAIPIDVTTAPEHTSKEVVTAGTVIKNDNAKPIGVLLYDVYPKENPNGAMIVHGFIDVNKLSAEQKTAIEGISEAVPQITLVY